MTARDYSTPGRVPDGGDAVTAVPAADLARERYLSLATCRKSGAEVRTPVWREGTARIADDPREIAATRAMMRLKYGWQVMLLDFFSRLTGRIRRRVWLAVSLR